MKIGVITDSLGAHSLTKDGAVALTRAIIEAGYAATLYVSEPLPENFLEEGHTQGVPVVALPSDFHLVKVNALEQTRKFSRLISELIDGNRRAHALATLIDPHLDALIVYGGKGYRTAYFFKKQQRIKIPVLWYVDTLPFFFYAYCDVGVPGSVPWCPLPRRIFYRLLDAYERWVPLKAVTHTVAMSREVELLLKRYQGKNVRALLPGVSLFRGSGEKQPLHGRDVHVLLHGEHLQREYAGDIAASVKALYDRGYHIVLTVLGDVQTNAVFRAFKDALTERAQEYGIMQALSFPGTSARESARELFASADVFLHLSESAESDAILFEAVGAGVPAIVLEAAAPRDFFTEGQSALFFTTLAPGAIAGRLQSLIDDEQLYRRLREGGKALVRDSLSWGHVAEVLGGVLEEKK